jgi:hypothetical protein
MYPVKSETPNAKLARWRCITTYQRLWLSPTALARARARTWFRAPDATVEEIHEVDFTWFPAGASTLATTALTVML